MCRCSTTLLPRSNNIISASWFFFSHSSTTVVRRANACVGKHAARHRRFAFAATCLPLGDGASTDSSEASGITDRFEFLECFLSHSCATTRTRALTAAAPACLASPTSAPSTPCLPSTSQPYTNPTYIPSQELLLLLLHDHDNDDAAAAFDSPLKTTFIYL